VELQRRSEEIRKTGFGLAAISYDPVTVLADFATRRGISFPLLSDVGSRVIREYGILNATVPPTNRDQYGIPFPGTFFVDRSGVVTSRVFENAYQERDTIASVMVRLGHDFAPAGTRVTASHLESNACRRRQDADLQHLAVWPAPGSSRRGMPAARRRRRDVAYIPLSRTPIVP